MFPPVIAAPSSDNFISIFIPALKAGFKLLRHRTQYPDFDNRD